MDGNNALNSIKVSAAQNNENYVKTNLNIDRNDDSTRNIISSTFSVIKNNIQNALMYAVGTDINVSIAYIKNEQDPAGSIQIGDKKLYKHPGVGLMQAYNEMGNPAGGVYTMHTIG
jgi:hypothetical protein